MILLIVGFDGPLTSWCRDAFGAVMDQIGTAYRSLSLDSAPDFLQAVLSGETAMLVTASRPDPALVRAVLDADCPFLFVTTPASSAAEVRVAQALSGEGRADVAVVTDIVRDVMADAAALLPLATAERGLRVVLDDVLQDPHGSLMGFAQHLNLSCPPKIAVAAAMNASSVLRTALSTSARIAPLAGEQADSGESQAVYGVLRGLDVALATGAPVDQIAASRHFFMAEDTREPPIQPLDATGRARLLVYGPFFTLPAGDWTARCAFSFSAEMVGAGLMLDVFQFQGRGGPTVLANTPFTVTAAGRLDVNLRFRNEMSFSRLEVRLFTQRAVFDGAIAIGYVEFRRDDGDVLDALSSMVL